MQQMPSNDVLLQQANPATLSSALPEAIQHTTWKQSVPIGQVQVGEVTAQPETSPPGVQTSPPAGAQTPLTNSCPAGQVTVPPARWHRLGLKHQLLPLAKTQQLQPVVPAQTPGSLAHRRFGQVWAAAGARRSPSTPSVPATKPVSTRRRLVPVASARVMSSNRCLSTSTNCSRCTRRPMAPLKRPLGEARGGPWRGARATLRGARGTTRPRCTPSVRAGSRAGTIQALTGRVNSPADSLYSGQNT